MRMTEDEESRGSHWQWVAGATAILLAMAIVVGMVYAGRIRSTQPHPAAAGHVVGSLTMNTKLDFKCTLPVQAYVTQARVSLPDGSVTVDQVQPLKNTCSYGSAYVGGRWLPVPATWVSPDGRSYAYTTSTMGVPGEPQTGAVNVHDIARTTDRKLWSGSGHAQMVGWGRGGVYFTLQPTAGAGKVGFLDTTEVWVVDPANPGAVHRVGPNPPQPRPASEADPAVFQFGTLIAADSAFTVKLGTAKGLIPPGGGVFPRTPAQVLRMDLRDGSLSNWFTAPEDTNVTIAGIDAPGHPVLVIRRVPKTAPQVTPGAPLAPTAEMLYPSAPEVMLLTGANQTAAIADGSNSAFRPSMALGDSHGIWFNSPGSVWLYNQGSLTKVADVPSSLFPVPTPPAGVPTPQLPYSLPSPPSGLPTGPSIAVIGPCG